MGFLSTKVVAGMLATTVVAGGVMFTGGETVDNVKLQLEELKNKVVQYEAGENSLISKIGLIKADASEKLTNANGKIVDAKTKIKDLEAEKQYLIKQTDNLKTEIQQLESDNSELKEELDSANQTIEEKQAELDAKQAELDSVNSQLEATKSELAQLQVDYDNLVAENNSNKEEINRLEAEVKDANDQVAKLGETSAEVEAATSDKEPMTEEELNAIGTDVTPDVFDAELVVKKLNLTYIQNGQSDEFKAEHPDLVINEGDRVWRVKNDNDFKVYVEWQFAGGGTSGEIVANPSQTFYMTGQGGTMIIKWQDENGEWQKVTKAGA